MRFRRPFIPWHKGTHSKCKSGQIAVIKDSDGSLAGCHDSEESADRQIAALYANEEDMSMETKEDQTQFTFLGPWGNISYAPGTSGVWVGSATTISPSTSPFATVTVTTDEPVADAPAEEIRWEAVLAIEGVPTDDNMDAPRIILPEAMSWRELPFPLLAMTEVIGEGHLGHKVAGRVDEIWREPMAEVDVGENVWAIKGRGVFDASEYGQEIARMVADKMLRGVSIDPGAVSWAFVDRKSLEPVLPEDMTPEAYMNGGYYSAMTSGKILGATVCPMQALEGATIEIFTASADDVEVRTAQIWLCEDAPFTACAAGPLAPPAEWFAKKQYRKLTPFFVTPEGQIGGHLQTWDCHVGYEDRCMRARPSRDGYQRFHSGNLVTAEGEHIKVGRIQVKPHAPYKMTPEQTLEYYSDVKTVAAFVVIWDDEFGIACAGSTRSDASPELLRDFYANPPSGEWRRGELMGFSSVPLPGLPVTEPAAYLVASASDEMEIDVLILPGVTEEFVEEIESETTEADVLVAAAALQGPEALAALIAE